MTLWHRIIIHHIHALILLDLLWTWRPLKASARRWYTEMLGSWPRRPATRAAPQRRRFSTAARGTERQRGLLRSPVKPEANPTRRCAEAVQYLTSREPRRGCFRFAFKRRLSRHRTRCCCNNQRHCSWRYWVVNAAMLFQGQHPIVRRDTLQAIEARRDADRARLTPLIDEASV